MINLVNDAFANRFALSGFDITVTGTTVGFTGEVDEPDHAEASGDLNSAWWSWTAPDSGIVSLDTFGSSYDTVMAVYTGSSLSTLAEVASNDDDVDSPQSAVTFDAIAGTTYQIAVDGFTTSTGEVTLNLALVPNNDAFANRTALNGFDASATGTNVGFTREAREPDHAGVSIGIDSAWWSWRAPTSGLVSINTFGSDFDTTLGIYTGSALNNLIEVASNNDGGNGLPQSAVAFDAVAGTTYQIAVDGFRAQTGNIDLTVNLIPDSNDDFADRITLGGIETSISGTNAGFTGEVGEPDHAEASGLSNSAWWTWVAPFSGVTAIDTFGSDFDTTLAVYTGAAVDTLAEVASNDDSGGELQSAVAFDAVAGTAYQIAVAGNNVDSGTIDLKLSLVPDNNDDFADRITLTGTLASDEVSNIGFTGEPGEPDHADVSDVLNSAWWTWTAPTSAQVLLDTFGSDFDTTLAVYTGTDLDTLVEVAANDDSESFDGGTTQSAVAFDAVAGTTYQIAVDGFSGESGNIDLNLLVDDTTLSSEPVDLILDFDGGALQFAQGYDIPSPTFAGFDFSAFTAFDTNDGGNGNLNEQVLQIIAGVREDFADFNVRVIWDDRGVDSPFFDGQDSVVMVVGDSGAAAGESNIFGIASTVDVPQFTGTPTQSRQDTAFAFGPAHVGVGPNTFTEIREIIDTISHEAGHTFGLSHSSEQDSEGRQLVTNVGQNQNLDSRFSPEPLDHNPPETGIIYAETDRLTDSVGLAPVLSGDVQSGQTLPLEPRTPFVGVIDPTDPLTASGSIDFVGDRDAFRFRTAAAGTYTIEQMTTSETPLNAVLTLWDGGGDFLALGNVGSGGLSSSITFNAAANATYYAVAGSEGDRVMSGVEAMGQTGGYVLELG